MLKQASVTDVCAKLDLFYDVPSNRYALVQGALPLMLAWSAAGPNANLSEVARKLRDKEIAPQK